jgi:Na+(H+)/acetate symporter ActP
MDEIDFALNLFKGVTLIIVPIFVAIGAIMALQTRQQRRAKVDEERDRATKEIPSPWSTMSPAMPSLDRIGWIIIFGVVFLITFVLMKSLCGWLFGWPILTFP